MTSFSSHTFFSISSNAISPTFEIPRGAVYRLYALANDSTVSEISYGYFDEQDIVRVEDFGRT
jgi:hypothetical protein